MTTVAIDLGDDEYELEVISYTPQEEPSRDNPGAGAEVDLDSAVKFGRERISLDEFIVLYADYHSLAVDDAEVRLREEVADGIVRQQSEEFDDRDSE